MPAQPLYESISASFREKIASGEWGEGTIIPPEVTLAQQYGVSRPTIRHALEPLVAEGILDRKRKRGTMVRRAKTAQGLRLDPLATDSVPADSQSHVEAISVRHFASGSVVAHQLDADAGAPVVCIARRRVTGDAIDALAQTYVTQGLVPRLADAELAKMPLQDVLTQLARPAVRARGRLDVAAAHGLTVSQLNIELGGPVLRLCATAYDADDQPVAYTEATYRVESNAFDLDMRP